MKHTICNIIYLYTYIRTFDFEPCVPADYLPQRSCVHSQNRLIPYTKRIYYIRIRILYFLYTCTISTHTCAYYIYIYIYVYIIYMISTYICNYYYIYTYIYVYIIYMISTYICNYYMYTYIYMYALDFKSLQHTATHCNTLQHTATHCNTLQHTADFKSRAPENDVVLTGRIPSDWLDVDFS